MEICRVQVGSHRCVLVRRKRSVAYRRGSRGKGEVGLEWTSGIQYWVVIHTETVKAEGEMWVRIGVCVERVLPSLVEGVVNEACIAIGIIRYCNA